MRPGALALPVAGLLTAGFALDAGGFFPDTVGIGAAGLTVLILLRLTLAREPFAGWSPIAAVGTAAGVLFATWVLLSALWSGAPGRAIVEFDRALLYVLAFAFMAGIPRAPGWLSACLRWVLLAIVAGAIVGLATRLYPDVFHAVDGRQPARLGYPLTYWNAMAVFCGLGVVLAVHVASGAEEPWWARVAACGALPILVVTGYFPFSRGGVAVAVVGIGLYVLLAHGRRIVLTVLCAGPPVAVALASAYGKHALSTDTYFSGAGPSEGHELARVVLAAAVAAACLRLASLPLERRIDAVRIDPARRRRLLAGGVIALVLVAIVAGAAVDAPKRIDQQVRGFVDGNVVDEGTDIRSRFTAVGNNGRLDFWRVDWAAFESSPLHGTGAGTYQLQWELRRPAGNKALDGHSLYLETLSDLGIVGLVLLVVFLGAALAGPVRGLRGPDRHAHAAVLAAGVALLLHAGFDWDWEMPALFAWFFCATGLAAARVPGAAPAAVPARLTRVLAGLGCLLVLVTPVLVTVSERSLKRAQSAFADGDCRRAIDAALSSAEALEVRPEPYEVLGYCNLRLGATGLAVSAMETAHRRDPDSWRYAYGIAVARGLDGRDPRPALALARRLNPRAVAARDLESKLRGSTPRAWRRAASRALLPD